MNAVLWWIKPISSKIRHFTGSSAPTDRWNIVTVYDTDLVNIKALYDLPQIWSLTGEYEFYCGCMCRITLAYNITPA